MVHAIRTLKCKKGHHLPITFDSNECGCHHEGKPCLIISCKNCFEEGIKKEPPEVNTEQVYLPLDEEAMKEIKKLLE